MSEPITVRGVSDTARWVAYFVRSKRGGPTPCSTTPTPSVWRADHGFRIANTLIQQANKQEWAWVRAPIFSISSFPAPFQEGAEPGCEPRCRTPMRGPTV